MRINIICWLIGHDFRVINIAQNERGLTYKQIRPSEFCRRCGLLKRDVL